MNGIPAVVVARGDGQVVGMNAPARRLMGDGRGRKCWHVVGGLENAQRLPCRRGCVGELLTSGMDSASHTQVSLDGRRHVLTCVPVDGAVVCVLSASAPRPQSWESLTAREREVLQLLSEGRTTIAIAVELGLRTSTVRTHVEHMRTKLGVTTRAALVARAFALGLLS